MPWETPIARAKAYEEFCLRVEKLPHPIPKPNYDPPMTYFNNPKSAIKKLVPYDLFNHFEEGFDPKSARDDRKSLPPIWENIFKEEERKYIPVTTALWYSRPLLLENPPDWGERMAKSMAVKDFYRRQGINISPELELMPQH